MWSLVIDESAGLRRYSTGIREPKGSTCGRLVMRLYWSWSSIDLSFETFQGAFFFSLFVDPFSLFLDLKLKKKKSNLGIIIINSFNKANFLKSWCTHAYKFICCRKCKKTYGNTERRTTNLRERSGNELHMTTKKKWFFFFFNELLMGLFIYFYIFLNRQRMGYNLSGLNWFELRDLEDSMSSAVEAIREKRVESCAIY